ncbi:MAG: hypothetical protein EHM58_04400 [Ignavibacteriae bacterium]|nr:MAG: hypothetical protein EHM58_04400 [Ignavibacteriota bacterium]
MENKVKYFIFYYWKRNNLNGCGNCCLEMGHEITKIDDIKYMEQRLIDMFQYKHVTIANYQILDI